MKRSKRLLAMLLTMILCIGEFSSTGFTVLAAGEGQEVSDDSGDIIEDENSLDEVTVEKNTENTMLCAYGMADPKHPTYDTDIWQGSYAYFGKYNGEPVKYRVLGHSSYSYTDDAAILLDCDSILFKAPFDTDNSNKWTESSLAKGLNGNLFFKKDGAFTPQEKSVIMQSTKTKPDKYGGAGWDKLEFAETDNKVFILDDHDVTLDYYGYWPSYEESKTRLKTPDSSSWWLRSSHKTNSKYAGSVNTNGSLRASDTKNGEIGVSPALNISVAGILFSTAISGKKGELFTEYKFTQKTNDFHVYLNKDFKVTASGRNISIPYKLSIDYGHEVDAISVLILDKKYAEKNTYGANILYYGKLDIDGELSETGVGSFVLPESLDLDNWGGYYKVYLVAEDLNGDKETDYASVPYLIGKDCLDTVSGVSVTFDTNGHGTAPATQVIGIGTKAKEPVAPTAEGYAFDGWYTNSKCTGSAFDFDTLIDKDITLYAKWTPVYTVTFKANGHGTAPASQSVKKGEKADRPLDPTASGFKFHGWYTNYACTGDEFSFDTPITKDTNLYAKWGSERYTVTFETNVPDIVVPAQSVANGSTAIEPAAPVRAAYVFGGWYLKADLSESSKYDFSTAVTKDFTLYAKWNNECKVSFAPNGGTGTMKDMSVGEGDYFILPACEFTAPAESHFGGWTINSALYVPGSKIKVTADITAEAYWIKEQYYTVEFSLNTHGGIISSSRIKKGEKVTAPAEIPSAEGAVFLGWYSKGYSDNSANNNYLFDFDKPITEDTTIYAAWRSTEKYHIVITEDFYMRGGSVSLDKDYAASMEDVLITVTPEEGYKFVKLDSVPYEQYGQIKHTGTIDASKFTGNTYTFTVPNMNLTSEKNIHMYACFEPEHVHELEEHPGYPSTCTEPGMSSYAICTVCGHKFKYNEMSGAYDTDITGDPDEWLILGAYHKGLVSFSETPATCTVSGNYAYTYCKTCGKYWIGGNLGVECEYEDVIIPIDINAHDWDDASVSYTWADNNSSVTASCVCKHNNEHKLTEEALTKETVIKAPTCDEDGLADYTSESFINPLFTVQTKTGVVLEKKGHDRNDPVYDWSDDYSSVKASVTCKNDPAHKDEETVTTTTEDKPGYIRYKADFTKDCFEDQFRDIITICFDMNGVLATDVPAPIKTDLGEAVRRPASDPKAEGYKFAGWYSDPGCSSAFDFTAPLMENTVVYARWIDQNATIYTISFNMMDHGVQIDPVEVESGKTVPEPVAPYEEGWVFDGWYKEEQLKNKYDFNTAVTGSFTLYAKWTENNGSEPAPESGHSPLDNRPEMNEETTELWLVKGQKFMIGSEWSVSNDKVSKKYVSISKKGQLKAKKDDGGKEVKITNGTRVITLHISKPEMPKKLTLTIVSANAAATDKIALKKDDKLNVLYYSASPDVAVVDQNGNVTAVAKGKAKITAYINGSAYTCNVTVKEDVTPLERTIHMTKGTSKPILKIKNVKKADWKSASDNVAAVVKNKIKAGNAAGTTVISAEADGQVYKINVIVEDTAISAELIPGVSFDAKSDLKYEIVMPKDAKISLSYAGINQDVIFKSSKPDIVFIDENGNVTARDKGKGKFTTKINGKTVTISVKVNG